MNENTNTKTAEIENAFRKEYKRVEFEKDGKKLSFPAMTGTILKFNLHAEIERLIEAGVSDTDILDAIREADAQSVSITSSGNVKGNEKYGSIALTDDEVSKIKSIKAIRQTRSATIAETFAVREGESKVEYVKRVYRENGGKIAIDEIVRQYAVQSVSEDEIEKRIAELENK